MSQREYEYYKQRFYESRYDLIETVTSSNKLLIAKIIDWAIFITLIILLNVYMNTLEVFTPISKILVTGLFMFIYTGIKILLKGTSLGNLIMGITYVNIKTKNTVTIQEFYKYILRNVNKDIRPVKMIKYYFSYNNRLLQNEPMKKSGFLVSDNRKYKKFKEDYQKTIKKLTEYGFN